MASLNPSKWFHTTFCKQSPEWDLHFVNLISLSSTGPLWEYPGNLLNQRLCQWQDCLRGNGISFGNVTASSEACNYALRLEWDAFSHWEESVQLCEHVGQGLKIAAYALCIINEHAERNHNRCSALHNASVFKSRVRGHVWLCAWLARTETNKETFESVGGFMYITRQQKKAVGCITGVRGQSVCTLFGIFLI